MKKLYKKTTIYVVRCDNKNKLQDSAPCVNCLETLINLKIKRIVYSSINSTFVSINPIDINICHESAGTKFLKKKDNKTNNKENTNLNRQ